MTADVLHNLWWAVLIAVGVSMLVGMTVFGYHAPDLLVRGYAGFVVGSALAEVVARRGR